MASVFLGDEFFIPYEVMTFATLIPKMELR